MKTGRPATPVGIHLLQGTYREHRHGAAANGVLADGEPKMPQRLRGEARKLWQSVVPGLIKTGVAKRCRVVRVESLETTEWSVAFQFYERAPKFWPVEFPPSDWSAPGN